MAIDREIVKLRIRVHVVGLHAGANGRPSRANIRKRESVDHLIEEIAQGFRDHENYDTNLVLINPAVHCGSNDTKREIVPRIGTDRDGSRCQLRAWVVNVDVA